MKYVFPVALGVLAVALLAVFFSGKNNKRPSGPALDAFAQCIAEKGAVMYGAYWCPHCQNEKRSFGDSFKYISYVECADNPKVCTDKGVTGFPTWIFPDGRKLEGEQGLEGLAGATGCALSD